MQRKKSKQLIKKKVFIIISDLKKIIQHCIREKKNKFWTQYTYNRCPYNGVSIKIFLIKYQACISLNK